MLVRGLSETVASVLAMRVAKDSETGDSVLQGLAVCRAGRSLWPGHDLFAVLFNGTVDAAAVVMVVQVGVVGDGGRPWVELEDVGLLAET